MASIDTLSQFNAIINHIKQSTGKTVHELFQKEFCRIKYDAVVDSEEEIILDLELSNVDKHPPHLIEVKIQSLSVEVKLRDFECSDHYLKICRLHDEINVHKSKYEIKKDFIEVTLVKVKKGKWHRLHYYPQELFKNFQDKVKAAMKLIPAFKGLPVQFLISEQIWDLEVLAMCGSDILSLYNEFPTVFKTYEQIIEDLKSRISSYQIDVFCLFAVLLIKERRNYEDSHPEALKLYESKVEKKVAKTQNEKKAETFKLEGNGYVQAKKYLEAIKSYNEAIELDPQCAVYYLNRAIAYFSIDLYILAIEDATKALRIDPFYCKAYYYLGECMLHDCLPDQALHAFKRAKILEPLNRKIEDKLVETYEFRYNLHMFVESVRQNNEKDREIYLKGLLKVMNESVAAEKLLKLLCDKNMVHEAKIEAKKLSKLHDSKDSEFNFLAICSYYEDDEEKFREYYRKCKKDSNHLLKRPGAESLPKWELCDSIEDIYNNRRKGDENFQKGNYDKAIEFYLKAIKNKHIIPLLSTSLLLKIGLAKRELKDDEFIDYIGFSLHFKSDNHEALAARGEFNLQKGNFESALRDFILAQSIFSCRRYTELIEKTKAKKMLADNSDVSSQENASMNKEVSQKKRKAAIKKKEGNKFFEDKYFFQASKCYSEAIELDDRNSVFYSNRAACYINMKQFDKAISDCEKALELDPSFAKCLFRLGQCYLAFGKMNDATSSFEKALQLKPSDKDIPRELQKIKVVTKDIEEANKLFDEKKYEAAAKHFSSIVDITVVSAEYYYKWMKCFILLGKYKQALTAGEAICDYTVDLSFEYYCDLAICCLHERAMEEAASYLENAIDLDPSNENGKRALALLSENDMFIPGTKECENLVQEILPLLSDLSGCLFDEHKGNLAESQWKEGNSYFEKKQYNDALYSYTDALSYAPRSSRLYLCRALCYFELNSFKEAVSDAKEALVIDDKCIKAFQIIGNCEITFGFVENAETTFREAEKLDPQNEETVLGLEKVTRLKSILSEAENIGTQNLHKAYDLYKEAVLIARMSYDIYEKFVECHLEVKPFDDLKMELKFNFGEMDDDYYASDYYLKGRRHYAFGFKNSSISYLQDAIQLNSSNKKYEKWLYMVKNSFDFIKKANEALRENNFISSLSYLNEALEEIKGSPVLLFKVEYYIGVVKMKQKKINESIEWFTKTIEKILPIVSTRQFDSVEKEREFFKENKSAALYIAVSLLEKRACCHKMQGCYEKAVKDYKELHKLTNEMIYLSTSQHLTSIKKWRK